MSKKDGNGRIVLLTCAIDLNGKIEDARADWEIVGWSETGASYSVAHGSIGTFIPREKEISDRKRWTYDHGKPYSVWRELDNILSKTIPKDDGTGKRMKVFISGIDAPSHFADQAFHYIDTTPYYVVGLKGKDGDRLATVKQDISWFRRSTSRPKLYLLDVNLIKDHLAQLMKLNHSFTSGEPQPVGYMNFPLPNDGLYTFSGFFQQYESEEKRIERNANGTVKGVRWVKRNSAAQNHFWDVRVYGMALREILISEIGRQAKEKEFTWKDYCDAVLGRR
jgi:hypothetical protein